MFIDTSRQLYSGAGPYTCTEDCFFNYSANSTGDCYLTVDGITVSATYKGSTLYVAQASGFAKSGSVIRTSSGTMRVFGLC